MSQRQKPDLAAALADVSGSSRRRSVPLRAARPPERRKKAAIAEDQSQAKSEAGAGGREQVAPVYQAPSREGTAPITGHFPKQVRDQLKILAIERSSTLYNLMAEAYNDLFAKYGKPEIAPHQIAEK